MSVYDLHDEQARLDYEQTEPMREFIERVSYKDWKFEVRGLSLVITIRCECSETGLPRTLAHIFDARVHGEFGDRELRRMVFERIAQIERHEAMEFFKVDGEAPFFPDHTPGKDPYAVIDRTEQKNACNNR